MHKVKKIFIVLVIAFLFCNIFNSVYAGQVEEMESPVGKPISKVTTSISPGDYKPDELSNVETELIFNKTGVILAAIRNISIVTSVIVLMVIGVKYILGSVEEKASYKETMVPYIIGCILATSGIVIVSYIYNAFH